MLSADSADVYFRRAEEILAHESLDPIVAMEVFARAGWDDPRMDLYDELDLRGPKP